MNVKRIKPEETKEWLLYKHYAKRIPNIVYAFGLFDGQQLVGVCTFGIPASPSLIVGSIGPEYAEKFPFPFCRRMFKNVAKTNGCCFLC